MVDAAFMRSVVSVAYFSGKKSSPYKIIRPEENKEINDGKQQRKDTCLCSYDFCLEVGLRSDATLVLSSKWSEKP